VRGVAWSAAAVALAVSACAMGGVPTSELPDAPIAFTYRTAEEARRRAEQLADDPSGPEVGQPVRRTGYNDIIATDDSLASYFGRLFGKVGEEERYAGRLAFLSPRTGEVSVVAAARRGSIALAWSPEHDRLLFSQPGDLDYQIYEYEVESSTVRPATHAPPAHTQACYGADGRIVVAAVDARVSPVRSYLAISGPGGRRPFRALTDGPFDHSPACSPASAHVAFVRGGDGGRMELLVLGLDSDGPPRRLAPGRHPAFSHDGEWIAFAAPYQRELRLWRMRPDGTGRAPIGRGIRHEARPAISPDGRIVAYVAAEEPPRRHLYLRRFDGTGDRILFADGDGEYPVW
jgi:Tol biopolymer transport system component